MFIGRVRSRIGEDLGLDCLAAVDFFAVVIFGSVLEEVYQYPILSCVKGAEHHFSSR